MNRYYPNGYKGSRSQGFKRNAEVSFIYFMVRFVSYNADIISKGFRFN